MVGLLLPDMTCQLYIIVLRYQVMHSEFPMSRGIVLYYTIGWIAGRLAGFFLNDFSKTRKTFNVAKCNKMNGM